MLTVNDFNALTDDGKAAAIWQGAFLADREEDTFTVQLYSLGSFYAEVFYDPKANSISHFQAFNSEELLVPYLAQIKFNQ